MRRLLIITAMLVPFAAHAQTTPPAQPEQNPPAAAGLPGFAARFAAANTTHDGHLTLAQAQAAGLQRIVTNFAQIDTANNGYVTLDEIRAWHKAQHRQMQAAGQN